MRERESPSTALKATGCMIKQAVIVHYNTPELTEAAIKSLWKNTPDVRVTVFDNSDKRPFPAMDGVTILDNTKGQLVDFDKMLERYPDKIKTACNWGSEKHIASVDYMFDVYPDGFLLLDSDILIKKDVSAFFPRKLAWMGAIEHKPKFWFQAVRCFPMILWLNVPMLKKYGIRFFHEGYVYKMSHSGPPYYDTGGSLLKDCNDAGLPFREIDMNEYIDHLGGASCYATSWRIWLDERKHLYEDMSSTKKQETKQPVEKKPAVSKDTILVVIPYCSAGAQGNELELAVAGWRKHFKEKYLIVLAGENHPITETGDDIICIESERVPEKKGQYRQHLDYVSCFKKVHAAFPKSKGFIFVADDVYAVNNFDMSDVKFLKQRSMEMGGSLESTNGWQRDKAKTRMLLEKEGYPTRNFTTHLPQWIEWDKLEALWEKYDMENESYVFEDLYFNIYYGDRIPFQLNIDHDNLKCGVYRSNPRINYIERAFDTQIWIQNSPEGWIPQLQKMLEDHYKI